MFQHPSNRLKKAISSANNKTLAFFTVLDLDNAFYDDVYEEIVDAVQENDLDYLKQAIKENPDNWDWDEENNKEILKCRLDLLLFLGTIKNPAEVVDILSESLNAHPLFDHLPPVDQLAIAAPLTPGENRRLLQLKNESNDILFNDMEDTQKMMFLFTQTHRRNDQNKKGQLELLLGADRRGYAAFIRMQSLYQLRALFDHDQEDQVTLLSLRDETGNTVFQKMSESERMLVLMNLLPEHQIKLLLDLDVEGIPSFHKTSPKAQLSIIGRMEPENAHTLLFSADEKGKTAVDKIDSEFLPILCEITINLRDCAAKSEITNHLVKRAPSSLVNRVRRILPKAEHLPPKDIIMGKILSRELFSR